MREWIDKTAGGGRDEESAAIVMCVRGCSSIVCNSE